MRFINVLLTYLLTSQKNRIIIFHGIKIWAQLSYVLSQNTPLTDGRTAFSWLDRDGAMHAMHAAR